MELTEEQLKQMTPEQIKEMQKKQCIFCKIIEGQVQAKKVYEDNKVIAILDINPANPGHVLLLPKEHYSIMPQMPEEEIAYMFVIVKQISQSLLRALQVDGTNIFIANGLVAGQKAPHFMMHIIPRKEGDGVPLSMPEHPISQGELEKLRVHIKKKVNKLFGLPEETEPASMPAERAMQERRSAVPEIKEAEIVREEKTRPHETVKQTSLMPPQQSRAANINIDDISKALLGMPAEEESDDEIADEIDGEIEGETGKIGEIEDDATPESDEINELAEEQDESPDEQDEDGQEEESDEQRTTAVSERLSGNFDFDDMVSMLSGRKTSHNEISKSHSENSKARNEAPANEKFQSMPAENMPTEKSSEDINKSSLQRPKVSVFIASKKSDRYHEPWCPFAVKVSRANRILFKTRAEAENAGKEACECVREFE